MKNDRRVINLLLMGLLLIFITLSTKWFFNNFERKEVEKTTGYSAEARLNKFLAAEYYLRNLGFDVESDNNRARLLENHNNYQTILINDYGPKLSPTHFKKLLTWLENGGHLIFTANDFQYAYDKVEDNEENEYFDNEFRNNQLLEKYGILPSYTNFNDYEDNCSNCDNEEDKTLKFTLNDDTKINVDFSSSTHLLDINNNASFSLSSRYGNHLLQYDIGGGKLTVLSENYFLSNDYIGEHDHAYLLSLLSTANHSLGSKILLLYNSQSDSIFTLIWETWERSLHRFPRIIDLIFMVYAE